jgi:uncharacterized phage protein gp47/JayE
MSFSSRSYDEIVRDLLTTLTQGTVRESATVSDEGGAIITGKLRNRPVRRISHVEELRTNTAGITTRWRYTPADYEVIDTDSDGEPDTIRFRKPRNAPAVGSTVSVNYYPQQSEAAPLTDLSVGSVTRTLMETFARELALTELSLKFIYESGFLETATGSSLDKVVALTGVKRLPAGYPTVRITFRRAPGTPGRISIPATTPVVDDSGNRYLTLESLTLEPYEESREVLAAGETAGTAAVDQGALQRLETMIAGIGEVINLKPSGQQSAAESDDNLRRRAGNALHGAMRGTLDALRYGLLSIEGVKSVSLTEFPNDIAGEVRVEVAYSDDSTEVRNEVTRRIKELKPAGIRVLQSEAIKRPVTVQVSLTMTGSGVAAAELESIKKSLDTSLTGYLRSLAPGGSAQARMSSLLLADSRIADARVELISGSTTADSITLADGEVFDIKDPVVFTTISAEQSDVAAAMSSSVEFYLPLHLCAGVTETQANAAVTTALTAYLQSRSATAAVSIDTMAAAIRDDSRYALIRDEASITIEKAGAFIQLADGAAPYIPAAGESMTVAVVNLDIREGSV